MKIKELTKELDTYFNNEYDMSADEVDSKTIDILGKSFGTKTKKDYDKVVKELDKLHIKTKNYEIYISYDLGGYEYWMEQEQEQVSTNIVINLKKSELPDDEFDKLFDDVIKIADKLVVITNKYDYIPENLINESNILLKFLKESRYIKLSEKDIDIDKIFKKVSELTNINDHGGALLYLAKTLGYKDLEKIIDYINKIHDIEGSIDKDLRNFRTSKMEEVFSRIKKQYGKDVFTKIKSAF